MISEATTGARAAIVSPQVVAHRELANSTLRQDLTQSMVLRPVDGEARVFAALEEGTTPEGSAVQALERNETTLRADALAHDKAVLASGLQVHTPDEALNRALAWSRLALDQAWVCNARIGCGIVAGYGPSRGSRRPQYAWFFAGDGLVATEALLAEGDAEHARAELAFILRYQNHANGMIWHEISQSAGFLDWAGKYPYMYVHVDITFQFLSTLADYYAATGDVAFLREHWEQIAAAYAFCRSIVNPETALPQIPAGKEGGNEQERMREDVGLSAAWVGASAAYQQLALAAAHPDEAAAAGKASEAARKALAARYWDAKKNFWIAGYSERGNAMTDERNHPGLLGQGLFAPEQEDAALDRLASADFQTDWGTRGMSDQSSGYNPDAYASGSVSSLATAEMAEAFWRDHRLAIGLPIFDSLLPWFQLDSLGHLHEVAAGDVYHPEMESVPEQTWSSAGFVHATIHGLLGIEVDAPEHRLTLAPHLDPRWDEVSAAKIPVGTAQVSAVVDQKPGELEATLSGAQGAVHVSFMPEIPLGAAGVRATVDGRKVPVTVEQHAQDEQARVEVDVPQGTVHCRIVYSGGVRVFAPAADPAIGDSSRQLKLTGVRLEHNRLMLDAEVATAEDASVEVQSAWAMGPVQGGTAVALGNHWYRVTFANAPAGTAPHYAPRHVTLEFQTR